MVAQQGHLDKCSHLAGVPVPTRPQITPSESRRQSRKQVETAATSSSEPSARATATPVEETPVRLLPLRLPPLALTHLLPWRQEEQAMASHGLSESRLAQTRGFRGIGPRSTPCPNPGGMSQDCHFPSLSKTVRGGSPPFCSSTRTLQNSLPPTIMWRVEGSCISIWRCCRKRPCTSEIRSPE